MIIKIVQFLFKFGNVLRVLNLQKESKDKYVTDFCQVVGKPEWIPEPFNKIEQKSKGKQK